MSDGKPAEADIEALAQLVQAEGHRLLSAGALDADPARLAAGWERRFITDGVRADEALKLYAELGFEVAADPLRGLDLPADCTDCQLATLLSFKTIYTRRR